MEYTPDHTLYDMAATSPPMVDKTMVMRYQLDGRQLTNARQGAILSKSEEFDKKIESFLTTGSTSLKLDEVTDLESAYMTAMTNVIPKIRGQKSAIMAHKIWTSKLPHWYIYDTMFRTLMVQEVLVIKGLANGQYFKTATDVLDVMAKESYTTTESIAPYNGNHVTLAGIYSKKFGDFFESKSSSVRSRIIDAARFEGIRVVNGKIKVPNKITKVSGIIGSSRYRPHMEEYNRLVDELQKEIDRMSNTKVPGYIVLNQDGLYVRMPYTTYYNNSSSYTANDAAQLDSYMKQLRDVVTAKSWEVLTRNDTYQKNSRIIAEALAYNLKNITKVEDHTKARDILQKMFEIMATKIDKSQIQPIYEAKVNGKTVTVVDDKAATVATPKTEIATTVITPTETKTVDTNVVTSSEFDQMKKIDDRIWDILHTHVYPVSKQTYVIRESMHQPRWSGVRGQSGRTLLGFKDHFTSGLAGFRPQKFRPMNNSDFRYNREKFELGKGLNDFYAKESYDETEPESSCNVTVVLTIVFLTLVICFVFMKMHFDDRRHAMKKATKDRLII